MAWEGSCADMFSVQREAGAGARAPASPGSSSFSNQRGQGELWALPQALCLCGWTLLTEDSYQAWQLDRMAFLVHQILHFKNASVI